MTDLQPTPKPQTCNGDLNRLPPALEHLRAEQVWVCWCWFWNGRKWTKPPRRTDNPDYNASSSDPATWGSYEQAVEQVRAGNADGIGFALKRRNIGGIDLDHCRDPETGVIDQWADEYLRQVPLAYAEATVSGKGLRILGASTLENFAPKFKLPDKGNGAAIEFFSNSNHYLTVSCNEITNCSELPPIGDKMADIAAELGGQINFDSALRAASSDAAVDTPTDTPTDTPINSETTFWSFNEEARLRAALGAIPTDEKVLSEKFGHSHTIWVKIGRAIERLDWGERGFSIFRDWSAQNTREFDEKGLRTQWASFNRNRNAREKPITIATVFHYAMQFGWSSDQPKVSGHNGEHGGDSDDEVRTPAFSDDSLALHFADQYVKELRYVAKWSTWLDWDGARWQPDDTLKVFDRARVTCRVIAAGCNRFKLQKELASAKTVAAVERLARSDRRLAATVEQWDADPWLLNTPAGVIDLHTGITRAHRAEDHITRITAVAPDHGECPLWHAFLDRVTDGDKALQQYLQRVCGYALTGSTREHALFFLWGTGANGKGTFVNAITGILADFHRSAPIETFTASHNDHHPTDLAGLRGARLVTANETEEGRRWAEAKVKMLTGGDKVSARFMRQDFFDFVPQFKLVIAGNHKPGLRAVDEAIRRRFNLIPFTVTIPPEERDPDLGEKLKAEWPAILQWMIDGCLDWQEQGLAPPDAVTAATDAYLEAQDAFSAWFDECCKLDPNGWERSQTLFGSWKEWAENAGHFVGDAKTFRARLERYPEIEHKPEPSTKRAGFRGVRFKLTAGSYYGNAI